MPHSGTNDGHPAPETSRLDAAGNSDSDEAEDEEIKLTCLAGARAYHDSDLETTPDQDHGSDTDNDDDDDGDEDREEPARDGVVQFVSQRLDMTRSPVVRPHATSPPDRPAAEAPRRGADSGPDGAAGRPTSATVGAGEHEGVNGAGDDALVGTGDTANEGAEVASTDDENEDTELAGILEFLDAGSVPVASPYADVYEEHGLPGARIRPKADDRPTRAVPNLPKTKRVLSYRTLLNLNQDAGHNEATMKRSKGDDESSSTSPFQPVLPLLDLGNPAIPLEAVDEARTQRTGISQHKGVPCRDRRDSCVSSDEEELDRQLAEELDVAQERPSRQNTPVPLLTPPVSPLTVDEQVVVCEWPSNLTIDNAMTALLSDIRPTSPQSLEHVDCDSEDDDDPDECSSPAKATKTSALTPLLRGISVGFE